VKAAGCRRRPPKIPGSP